MRRQCSLGKGGVLVALVVLLACAGVSQVLASPNVNMCASGCTLIGVFNGNVNSDTDAENALASQNMSMALDTVDIFSGPPGNTGSRVTTTRGEDFLSGMWTSTKAIDFVAVKAGMQFALYQYTPAATSGLWSTSNLVVGMGSQPDVSHLAFFMKATAVPEPSTTLLLGIALFGVVVARKAWRN